jgi:hypothetical protein
MKKFFTILALTLMITITIFSCTEEEVQPKVETSSSGGGAMDKGF